MVTVLHRDKTGLQGTQHGDGADDNEWRPQNEMHPDRRCKFYLDQGGEADDDRAKEENDQNRWAVSRILCGEVEIADLAGGAHLQQPGE